MVGASKIFAVLSTIVLRRMSTWSLLSVAHGLTAAFGTCFSIVQLHLAMFPSTITIMTVKTI